MPRLSANVALRDPQTDKVVVFGPDDDVPAWAAERIRNPKAWAADASAGPEVVVTAPAKVPVGESAAGLPDNGQSAIPPKGGPGSGRDAWAAYAAVNGVTVDEDAGRDDVIAALEAADVPTE